MVDTEDDRSLSDIHDAIVERIQELNDNQLTQKEAEEAARNLLGFCNKVIEISK